MTENINNTASTNLSITSLSTYECIIKLAIFRKESIRNEAIRALSVTGGALSSAPKEEHASEGSLPDFGEMAACIRHRASDQKLFFPYNNGGVRLPFLLAQLRPVCSLPTLIYSYFTGSPLRSINAQSLRFTVLSVCVTFVQMVEYLRACLVSTSGARDASFPIDWPLQHHAHHIHQHIAAVFSLAVMDTDASNERATSFRDAILDYFRYLQLLLQILPGGKKKYCCSFFALSIYNLEINKLETHYEFRKLLSLSIFISDLELTYMFTEMIAVGFDYVRDNLIIRRDWILSVCSKICTVDALFIDALFISPFK